jgi:ribose transport system substrate-binding protein
MKKVSVLSALFCLLCVGSLFAADITIAVMPKGLDNPVFGPTRAGAEAEGKKLGVEVIWVGPAETSTEGQIAVIESLIAKGVDAIALSANDATALNDVINEAVAAGIIVTTWDSDASGSKRLFYVGTNNYDGGFKAGQEMLKLVGADKKVAVLSGSPEAANLNERIQGFKDAVKESNIQVTDTVYCYDSVDEAINLVEVYTKTHSDFDGWYFAGGWPLWGGAEQMANLKAFKGSVVCFDFFPSAKAFTKELIDVSIGQNFESMGMLSVRYITDVIRNGKSYPEINDSGVIRVDNSNIDQY